MPKLVWLYLTALLYYRTSATGVAFAEALQTVSHDRFEDVAERLVRAHTPGRRLSHALRLGAWVWIIDDAVFPNPLRPRSKALRGYTQARNTNPSMASHWSSWCGRTGSLDSARLRLWPRGGPSKYALAVELLSYARNRLCCCPDYVLFDAWYPSRALLKRIHDYGWYFVCRLQKNRRCNGPAVRSSLRHPYGAATGRLTGGLKVLFFDTSDSSGQTPEPGGLQGAPAPPHRNPNQTGSYGCFGGNSPWAPFNPPRGGRPSLTSPAAWPPSVSWNGNAMIVASALTNSDGPSVATGGPSRCQRWSG